MAKRQAHVCVLNPMREPVTAGLVEAPGAEHQLNLIKADDNQKLGERMGLCKSDREGRLGKWLVAVVWWLRMTAKNLRPRMSLTSTPKARNEQIKTWLSTKRTKKTPLVGRQAAEG